jgi:Trk K+ transport system NAD-binding subunit
MGLGVVNYAVISLHRRMPSLRRPFKVALYPLVPIAGIITTWAFVPALELRSFLLGGALTLVGVVVYLVRPENRAQVSRGIPQAIYRLKLFIQRLRSRRMRVLIISGGRQGRNIADRLLAHDEYRMIFRAAEHQITFVEEDEEVCELLEKRYGVPIYQGDGTQRELLEQVGAENVDITIAASDDDGRNVIAALQARRLGMGRVMAVVQDPDYIPLLAEQGVEAVSAPWATAAMVENYLDRPGVAELFEIESGVAGLISVTVPEGGRVAGHEIQGISIPKDCVVAAVIRERQFVVPRGNTRIEAGDVVVVVGPTAAIKEAHEIFLSVG